MNKDIMAIEFAQMIAGYEMPKVALFNKTVISEEEVVELILKELVEYSNRVAVISKIQYENLCKGVK